MKPHFVYCTQTAAYTVWIKILSKQHSVLHLSYWERDRKQVALETIAVQDTAGEPVATNQLSQ